MGHNLSTMHTRTWTDVIDVIGLSNGLFIVFDNDHSISLITKVFQCAKKSVIVTLMQSNGRFVQNIKNTCQARSNLTGQSDPLTFPPRQRARIARQGQIFQTNIVQKSQTFADFLKDRAGDFVFLIGQMFRNRGAPFVGLFNRHLHHLAHMDTRNFNGQSLGAQTITAATAAGAVVLVILKLFSDPIAISFAITPFHIGNNPFKGARYLIDPSPFVIAELDFFIPRSIKEHLLHFLWQVFPTGVLIELVMFGDGFDGLKEIGAFAFAPWGKRPIGYFQHLIGDNKAFVKIQFNP